LALTGGARRAAFFAVVRFHQAAIALLSDAEPRRPGHVCADTADSAGARRSAFKELKMKNRLIIALVVLWVAGCANSSHVLVGTARPPISPTEVRVYPRPPARFEEIALLDASSKSAFEPGSQRATDKVIERLKAQAAQLGANGIILDGFSDREAGSLGTGIGSDSYSRHSEVGVGIGGSLGIYKKTGKARAIYVPPG
jgi:hypothetical protein